MRVTNAMIGPISATPAKTETLEMSGTPAIHPMILGTLGTLVTSEETLGMSAAIHRPGRAISIIARRTCQKTAGSCLLTHQPSDAELPRKGRTQRRKHQLSPPSRFPLTPGTWYGHPVLPV